MVRISIRRYWRQYTFGILVTTSFVLLLFSGLPTVRVSTVNIGVIGTYNAENLPEHIAHKIGMGLMRLSPDGLPVPNAVADWDVTADGKTYTFHLNRGLFWHNGTPVYADNLGLSFAGSTGRVIDSYTIAFTLEEPFAPFLSSLTTQPIRHGFLGFGPFRVKSSSWAENRLSVLTLENTRNQQKLIYHFYPNAQTAITAMKLGEIEIVGTHAPVDFSWENIDVVKVPSDRRVTALFFRMTHPLFGGENPKVRQAFAHAVPQKSTGPTSPIPPSSWVYSPGKQIVENQEIAKQLLADVDGIPEPRSFTLTTLPPHEAYAKIIAAEWRELGFDVAVDVQQEVPEDFAVLLADQEIPRIPDQYLLWHSTQEKTNITRFADKRIDKLLEDGRHVLDPDTQKKIYTDFQRFLMQDLPVVFLEYPPYTIYFSKQLDKEHVLEFMKGAY